ncbi:hypothetical protein GR241_33980, partial [Rhizobium leguminosarum]|nr:hypothetical protein [Rhizobium ruizarguesonis]
MSIRSEFRRLELPHLSFPGSLRMNIHKNARLTPLRREEMALAVAKGQV